MVYLLTRVQRLQDVPKKLICIVADPLTTQEYVGDIYQYCQSVASSECAEKVAYDLSSVLPVVCLESASQIRVTSKCSSRKRCELTVWKTGTPTFGDGMDRLDAYVSSLGRG